MKKTTFTILFALLLITSCVFSSCNANQRIFEQDSETDSDDPLYSSMILDLENQIVELQQNHYISNSENQQELQKLQSMLAELKGQVSNNNSPSDTTPPTTDDTSSPSIPSTAKFLYTVEDGSATITGYTGDDEHLVIPSVIDGYTVSSIGDNAFTSKQLKSVIITNGITKIGWFAFYECTSLSTVTIPSSISSIGYSAFYAEAEGFTVYCHSDSFAQKYAQSYGISCTVI